MVRVTYDPRLPEYAITLTRADAAWTPAPVFSIQFDGTQSLKISTDRQRYGAEGRALSVTDRGFDNVLAGLALNETATGILGSQTMTVSLAGAADPVQAFRTCATSPSV